MQREEPQVPGLCKGAVMEQSYDSFCLIAIAAGLALILGLSLIAAFCFPEKKKK